MALTETQAAYLAGLFDGEGTFGIYRVRTRGFINYRPTMKMVTTSHALAEYVAHLTGFSLCTHRASNGRCRESYSVGTVAADKLLPVLHAVFPYLVLKREAASAVIEFLAVRGKSGAHTPPDVLLHRELLAARTHELNRRGCE